MAQPQPQPQQASKTLETFIWANYKQIAWYVLLAVILVTLIMSLLPLGQLGVPRLRWFRLPIGGDKIAHFFAFMVIAACYDAFYYSTDFNFKKAFTVTCYGVLIEGLQSLTSYRYFSLWDIVADVCGVFAYWACIPIFQRIPIIRIRWDYQAEKQRSSANSLAKH